MSPSKSTISDGKRKASTSPETAARDGSSSKKSRIASESPDPIRQPHFNSQRAEENGVVLRKFYPPEMSNARAAAYINDELPRPIEVLQSALSETKSGRGAIEVKEAVVHWFKCDLRTRDNRSLHMASEKAKENGVPLITMYIVSPQDFEAHLASPARVDFILRTLEILKKDLAQLDIPLYIETVEKRRKIPGRIVELLQVWGASHIFANMEYEVDELRRDARMVRSCLENDIAMDVVPDTCVVAAGEIKTGAGKQYSVFTPWLRSWIAYIHSNDDVLGICEPPSKNPASARDKFAHLFKSKIPNAPDIKKLSNEEKKRFGTMWPAGEHEAHRRLNKFCEERIGTYVAQRDIPGVAATSSLSAHLASGTLSARTAVSTARAQSNTTRLDGGNTGMQTWIREIGWRDFYKHVLANWPYICMNKPWKATYSNIEWEYNPSHFEAWCAGRTGYPIVDAAMRQLNHCGYMHNRCRMIAASFLAKHLLVDWRMGERYFMEHLIDGDFASNNGGWGYSASTGVDPQPYFRIFNPLLQSEKFDGDGVYIRTWVKELEGIQGKAIHDPYGRGKGEEARSAGYPERIVPHKESRERCLERYQEGIGGAPK